MDQSFLTNKEYFMNGWVDGFVFFFFFWLRSRLMEKEGESRRLNCLHIRFPVRFTFLNLKVTTRVFSPINFEPFE